MNDKDRCLTALQELELELRMLQRVVDIYEDDVRALRDKKNIQEMEIKELKKEIRRLQIGLERGIS